MRDNSKSLEEIPADLLEHVEDVLLNRRVMTPPMELFWPLLKQYVGGVAKNSERLRVEGTSSSSDLVTPWSKELTSSLKRMSSFGNIWQTYKSSKAR